MAVDCALDASGNLLLLSWGQQTITNYKRVVLTKFNSTNGSLDTSFGNGAGYVAWEYIENTVSPAPKKLIIHPDGGPLVIGYLYNNANNSQQNPLLVKFDFYGNVDSNFLGSGYWTIGDAQNLAAFHSGVIDAINNKFLYLTGWKQNADGSRDMSIWKFSLTSKSLVTSFANSGVWQHSSPAGGGGDVGLDIRINPKNHYIYVAGRRKRDAAINDAAIWSFK
jgi:hypothetical protein